MNLYCLLKFILHEEKKPGLYFQQEGNTLTLSPQLFCQQIDKKYSLVK